jgi:hypothetical protein
MVCAADSPERPPPTTMTLEDIGDDAFSGEAIV